MNTKDRYSTRGLIENEFEPGSGKKVLKNLPGIKSKRLMDKAETDALLKTQKWAINFFSGTHQFTEDDIRKLHKMFLGKIYPWAGNYRNVNLYKGGFPFAPAGEIPGLMADFSMNILAVYAPCIFKTEKEIIEAISIVHSEFVLIHPFREGNGRLARLLSGLMALQAGFPSLDFTFIKGKIRVNYYRAIQNALGKDYTLMKGIIKEALFRARLIAAKRL